MIFLLPLFRKLFIAIDRESGLSWWLQMSCVYDECYTPYVWTWIAYFFLCYVCCASIPHRIVCICLCVCNFNTIGALLLAQSFIVHHFVSFHFRFSTYTQWIGHTQVVHLIGRRPLIVAGWSETSLKLN